MSKSLRSVTPNFYKYQNHLDSLLERRLLDSIHTIPLSRVGPENLCSQVMISSQVMIMSPGVLVRGKSEFLSEEQRNGINEHTNTHSHK